MARLVSIFWPHLLPALYDLSELTNALVRLECGPRVRTQTLCAALFFRRAVCGASVAHFVGHRFFVRHDLSAFLDSSTNFCMARPIDTPRFLRVTFEQNPFSPGVSSPQSSMLSVSIRSVCVRPSLLQT